jgi:hypothetical protein
VLDFEDELVQTTADICGKGMMAKPSLDFLH